MSADFAFANIVRDYLDGKVDWETVHRRAIQMEVENKADFPDSYEVLQELHTIFLADAKDDPQFRADREEIAGLLAKLSREQG
jgi:hypothetical protein